jgi:hypothetical protein
MKRLDLAIPVALLLLVISFAVSAQAQYRTSIQGVVTDPTGAVVSGATLTLTNPATGEKRVRTSNDAGVYNFNALPAAPFRLEVEKSGFEQKILDNVQLIPEQANALDIQLDVGAATQTVNVDASMLPAIDTQTASINGTISHRQIQHLPSFGRDVTKLAILAPGAFGDGSQASGTNNYNSPARRLTAAARVALTASSKRKMACRLLPMGNRRRTTASRLTASAP